MRRADGGDWQSEIQWTRGLGLSPRARDGRPASRRDPRLRVRHHRDARRRLDDDVPFHGVYSVAARGIHRFALAQTARCGALLVERYGYRVLRHAIRADPRPRCRTKIAGVGMTSGASERSTA